ncbi:hypothetical protein BDZ97DRAFT_1752045 [Flammula alnicola]|nr:hypothetical protein BDZ97DRAFT_1752045 [Flammula alnicola]
MTSTPKSHPAVQRLNRAYRALGTPTHVAGSSSLKENTPLRPCQLTMNQHGSSSASLKRKLSDREPPALVLEGVIISTKKSRLSTGAITPLKAKQIESTMPPHNTFDEFSNEFTYCHQCNKKRDVNDTLRCTVVEYYSTMKDKNIKERLCTNKYCKSCLKNRYEEDIDALKSQLRGKNGATYGFKCPRCRDICNCSRCRKSKGLEATGILAKPGPKPSESLPKVKKPKVQAAIEAKVKEPVKLKAKQLPTLKWTPLSVRLTREEADQRIFIREFVLRFGEFLDPAVAKSNVEELELIGGRPRKQDDDNNDTMSWVSDMFPQIIKATVKELRSAGASLNKIWAGLASLRDGIASISTAGSDASSEPFRQSDNLVTVVNSVQMIPVLVSLIHSVLETAIIREEIDQGARDARDVARDVKDAIRMENERWEKERSTIEVASKDKIQKTEARAKRMLHKEQIANIDNSLKIIGPSFSSRFMALGTDDEGRVYYALSPGVAEREAALGYLQLAANMETSEPKKKGRVLSSAERSAMREWSWFVGVWGRKPPFIPGTSKLPPSRETDVDADEEDEDVEKWWGFWEPDEITKLAEWISIKSGIDGDENTASGKSGSSSSNKEKAPLQPVAAQLKRLVMELRDYAALLQWRARDDKCTLVKKVSSGLQANPPNETGSKGQGKLSTVSVDNFYK